MYGTKDVKAILDQWKLDMSISSLMSLLEHSYLPSRICKSGTNYVTSIVFFSILVILSNQTLLEQLRAEKYDLAIAEPVSICGFGKVSFVTIN